MIKKTKLAAPTKKQIMHLLFLSLYDKLSLKVPKNVELKKVDKSKNLSFVANISVFDKFESFQERFKKKHLFEFFEFTQPQIKLFCQNYLIKDKKQEIFFQTKKNLKIKYANISSTSSLSLKNNFISKPKKESSCIIQMEEKNDQTGVRKPQKNLKTVQKKRPSMEMNYNVFKRNFLYNFNDQLDIYYTQSNLYQIFKNVSKKTSLNPKFIESKTFESNFSSTFFKTRNPKL